ncbi:VOC family protein [Paraconexibacter antarcticus]|uniref:VOC family protein n=1 Tax=Paraconexibacter antarcticus TaxID=2949664 RepID=A0ABY5DVE2_9ACTN|nr:VOC family protein [Paraconexibacter antarcticus]UTI65978.1 VOC family protein [Paraconexibacter antarcticus]
MTDTTLRLEGLHHITAITADAPANVDFYARLFGLRLVKKTVNFDAPDVYHLYYGDEQGTPGSILTFFEFPGAAVGRAGDGMVHTILWRVPSPASLEFWDARLDAEGVAHAFTADGALRFTDPEGLAHELVVTDVPDRPLVADASDIPAEHALQGFAGVRAYASAPERSAPLLQALGLTLEDASDAATWTAAGVARRATITYEPPLAGRGRPGAGTIHHIAWSVADDGELEAYRGNARAGGAQPTPIIDRQYFHSVYFREPSGVLFELASRDIGFDVDEPAETLGSELKLPPQYEARRAELVVRLTPIVNPRQAEVTA